MATILIAITGQSGVTNACLELGRRLTLAGHRVTLTAPRDRRAPAAAAGLDFVLLPAVEEHPERRIPAAVTGGKYLRLLRALRHGADWRRRADELIQPAAFAEALARLQPDLLLAEVELHEYILHAWGQRQKMVLLSQWYSLWDQPGLPYLLTDVVPGRGAAGSPEAMAGHWQNLQRSRLAVFRKTRWLTGGADRRSALLRMADRVGFSRKYLRKTFWPGPLSYTDLPVLTMAPLEMEFPHDPPDFLTYVGPMVFADRPEDTAVVSLNGVSLAELFERQQAGAKLILCTVTTMRRTADGFLDKLIAAVRERPDWLLVLGLGGQNDDFRLPEGVNNVFPFGYVPQLSVLARADLSVNQGGIHTIHECLHFGVPMLVYHGKVSDQPGCAARVAYHGVGLMADKDADTAADIQVKINEVLTVPGYTERVAQLQAQTRHYAATKVAERAVAKHLQQNQGA